MSSISKGLTEAFDLAAMQQEYRTRKAEILKNADMYSKKYDIPTDAKHFAEKVMSKQEHESNVAKSNLAREKAKQEYEANQAKQLEHDKENIDLLKAKLAKLQSSFDPNYEYSDDHTFWSTQKDIASKISSLKKRISRVEGEKLDELSTEKLAQYKTAAAADAGKADKEGDYKKADKRFSGIVKATKKQFANDAKTVKENMQTAYKEAKSLLTQLDESTQQEVINALKKNVDDEKGAFKTGYPRINNPKILGTDNKAKSIYYPPSKPNVKKLDKPLPESLGDQLKSKSIEALQQVKQKLEQQRMADLEQWEKDFKQNTVAKFTARQPSFMQQQPKQVAKPLEKHSVLKARLAQLDKAIEKQAILDKMLQRLEAKGLLTPAIQSDTDTSMLVRDGANDNYVSLNQKLDKALEFVKNRLLTNKAAFAKPKAIDENEELDENLHKWFKEKWVRFGPDGKIRGDCARGDDSEGKPKCLPQSKAHSLGKKGRASAAARKRREDPNPERSGKAINVNTKKKSNEGVAEGSGFDKWANDRATSQLHKLKRDHSKDKKANPAPVQQDNNGDWEQRQIEKMKRYRSPEQGVAEAELDEACWKGYHKEGNKKMFGKTYPNCVKNTNEEQELNEFAPDGFNGDDGDEFNPNLAKMAQEDGFTKGASLADGATTQRAMAINDWDKHDGGIYSQHFAKGFIAGRKDKIRHNNKQYNLNLKLMKDGSIRHGEQGVAEEHHSESCPHCGGEMVSEELMNEKKDACYYKVKSRYKVWPSAYASGALVKCRKKGASNWGNGGKSNESIEEDDAGDVEQRMIVKIEKEKQRLAKLKQTDPEAYKREMGKSKTSGRVPPVSTFEDQGITEIDSEGYKGTRDDYELGKGKEHTGKSITADKMIKAAKKVWDYATEPVDAPDMATYKRNRAKNIANIRKNKGVAEDQLDEKWTKKYKDSINCSNPKGFSQKAHCAGKQKNESSILQGLNQLDEGWKEKLGAAALAGSMALGAGAAHSRVTPDGQGGFTGGLKPSATVTAPSDNKPAAEAPKGFSKEYLQKAADPNRTGRYMISVEKAQELLKGMQ